MVNVVTCKALIFNFIWKLCLTFFGPTFIQSDTKKREISKTPQKLKKSKKKNYWQKF